MYASNLRGSFCRRTPRPCFTKYRQSQTKWAALLQNCKWIKSWYVLPLEIRLRISTRLLSSLYRNFYRNVFVKKTIRILLFMERIHGRIMTKMVHLERISVSSTRRFSSRNAFPVALLLLDPEFIEDYVHRGEIVIWRNAGDKHINLHAFI